MNRIPRCLCILPRTIESLCKTGCIYRESAFKHLACPRARKEDVCCAPCPPSDCSCRPGRKPREPRQPRQPTQHKYYQEMFLLLQASDPKLQLQMR